MIALVGAALLLAGLGRSLRSAEAATGSTPAPSGSSASATPTAAAPSSPAATPPIDGGSSTTGSDQPTTGVDLDRAGSPIDWLSVVDDLDEARTAALAAGSLTALAAAVDPKGAAWAADAALARRIAASHAVVQGGGLVVTDLRVVSATDDSAVLLVRDRREPYSVTAGGRTAHVAARGLRWWRLRLAQGAAGWLVEEVTGVSDADVPGSAVSTPRGP